MGEKESQIVLKRFWKALKPEKQFTEGIHVKITQLKMIKPTPGMGNYHLHTRLNRLQIPPARGQTKCGDATASPSSRVWQMERQQLRPVTATVPSQVLLGPR